MQPDPGLTREQDDPLTWSMIMEHSPYLGYCVTDLRLPMQTRVCRPELQSGIFRCSIFVLGDCEQLCLGV